MDRYSEIGRILDEHRISRLCHMTQIDKLFSILYGEEGIWATAFCNSKSMYRNDMDRYDGKTEYISTSIEYPNVWYYSNKKNVNPYVNNWAVIFIDPTLSREDKTLFCPINSAASKGAYISGDAKNLSASFNQQVGYRRRNSNMLYCCPTDDQAEILLYKHVSVSSITGIAFESEHTLNTMLKLFDKYSINYPDLYLSKELFSTGLSDLIRNGCRPREIVREKGKRTPVLVGCA